MFIFGIQSPAELDGLVGQIPPAGHQLSITAVKFYYSKQTNAC